MGRGRTRLRRTHLALTPAFLFGLLAGLLGGPFGPGFAPSAAAEARCEVELVLAMDVSRSVSTEEYELQMNGLADAFKDEEVRSAVRSIRGGVMATVMIWGDRRQQKQTTPWTHLRNDEDLDAFSASIAETQRTFGFTLTGLGAAMAFADDLADLNPKPCYRRVIDVSGDGVWNDGPRPSEVWPTLSPGVTVNGLVILGATPDPYAFYEAEVIGGPGAFVEVAASFTDYAEAIRLKLLRELAPSLSMRIE
ncbi:MAG: DUF1194 domain-containing protein [Pseudomonadota bacterium]